MDVRTINPSLWAQRTLGLAVRARVAGPDADREAAQIWQTEGPRWFRESDPIWRVHSDASMFPAGIAALLLQSLHPGAMAGVAGHSGYRGDPWGRLQRTSRYIAATTYGTIAEAEATIAKVASIHRRIRGKDDVGMPYRADDPHLLEWVHIAEIHSFLTSHQRYGQSPLSAAEADLYVHQTRVAASLLGAVELPDSVSELDAAIQSYRPELRLSVAAREARDMLLKEPPLPRLTKPGYAFLAMGGIGLLPRWAREQLEIERPYVNLAFTRAGSIGVRAVRWGMSGVPR